MNNCDHITIKSPYCSCSMCNICGNDLNICGEHAFARSVCAGCGSLVAAIPDKRGRYHKATLAPHGCAFDNEPCTNAVTG